MELSHLTCLSQTAAKVSQEWAWELLLDSGAYLVQDKIYIYYNI